ncbi:hypothetical protein CGCTS75_v012169 [Colletotrichum tropicale]|nr:hypothetical protein CGCTS75_v012169 [Colletotrichum tropicale]
MRRRAKTPVYTIGQLESTPGAKDPVVIDRSSVDLIAKQYQALIESQDSNSICTDARSDPPPSRQSSYTSSSLARSTCSAGEVSEDLRPDVYQSPARTHRRHVSAHSPTSDDGTLVAFDEEAIYFKPMSFSPEPSSPSLPPTPPPRSRARVQRSSEFPAADHNLSLQICTDLLARELSTAMIERPRGSGEDISSLQIWVMIEAYERLRDQVKDKEGAQHLEPMFDTWLAALYTLHDKLTNDANSFQSHYETTGAD